MAERTILRDRRKSLNFVSREWQKGHDGWRRAINLVISILALISANCGLQRPG